ncbi:hypothetical protein AWC38_SpisGene20987 [Stylophora pistillata]|uniref:Uncharacterized protein n=1 Tax=Stylophora pistillata TaxID=50429 RepID=A0A2B4RCE7_STYPI|nr:hypothetical protein AWC38_SpisGene20987 [Stylophora pistillata]
MKFCEGRRELRRSRYAASGTTLPALKAYRILNIAQFSLFAAGLIPLAGDISPQPGPSFQLKNSGLSFGPKSRGLARAHLNIRSLLHKIDQVNLIMGGVKSFDILSFSETWLNDSVTDDEILMPGYSCVRRDRQGKVLDNTINKVAEEVLSTDEMEERQPKIQGYRCNDVDNPASFTPVVNFLR